MKKIDEVLNYIKADSESEQVVWDPLEKLLRSPITSSSEKAAEIADEVRRLEAQEDTWDVLGAIWEFFVYIISNVCRDSPLLDVLVRATRNLQQTKDPLAGENMSGFHGKKGSLLWKNLPGLDMAVLEQSNADPTADHCRNSSTQDDYESWISFHAWLARVMSPQFMWINHPVRVLRDAFEEPALKGAAMECRLEVAREWIVHAGEFLFKELIHDQPNLCGNYAASLKTGSLCSSDITPLSVGRWEFWKKRLLEIDVELDTLELAGTAVASRIPELVQKMDEIQKAGTGSSTTDEKTKGPEQGPEAEVIEGTASQPDKGTAPEKGEETVQSPESGVKTRQGELTAAGEEKGTEQGEWTE